MNAIRYFLIFVSCFIGSSYGEISSPGETTTLPTEQPIESQENQQSQPEGPDLLELSSTRQKELAPTDNKNINALFKTAENISTIAAKTLDSLSQPYQEFNQKFDSLNIEIDKFFQESAGIKGKYATTASKKTLETINQVIQNIKVIKKAIKDQIKEIDQRLSEVRTAAAPLHKNSLKILSMTQEADAQSIVNNINNELSKIYATQSFIVGDFTTSFNNNITKIEELLAQGSVAVQALTQEHEQKLQKKQNPQQNEIDKIESKQETKTQTSETKPYSESDQTKKTTIETKQPQAKTYRVLIADFLEKVTIKIKNFFAK